MRDTVSVSLLLLLLVVNWNLLEKNTKEGIKDVRMIEIAMGGRAFFTSVMDVSQSEMMASLRIEKEAGASD